MSPTPEVRHRSEGGRSRGDGHPPAGRRITRPGAWLLVLMLGLVPLFATTGNAGAQGAVTMAAVLNGAPLTGSSTEHPVRLDPARPAQLTVHVHNTSRSAIEVQSVEIEGTVAGLTFFSYDTAASLRVRPGASATLKFTLDLSGLGGQVTGLVPGAVDVLDAKRHVIASQPTVFKVVGSLVSVYGLFGLMLLILTGLAIADVLVAVALHRLSKNRWRRGVRFVPSGIGLGLVFTFSLSAFNVWVPSPAIWIGAICIPGAVFLLLGYLSPTPVTDEDEDDTEDDTDDHDDRAGLPALPVPAVSRPAELTP